MSFDIHNALNAFKIYGILLITLFAIAVLQPQRLLAVSPGAWFTEIGAELWLNLLAVTIVTAVAAFWDVFGVRKPQGPVARR